MTFPHPHQSFKFPFNLLLKSCGLDLKGLTFLKDIPHASSRVKECFKSCILRNGWKIHKAMEEELLLPRTKFIFNSSVRRRSLPDPPRQRVPHSTVSEGGINKSSRLLLTWHRSPDNGAGMQPRHWESGKGGGGGWGCGGVPLMMEL